ncbi:bacterioferritin-associated ferredoxin [Roseibium sp. TrichSKD4]|uniref:(2Fe-2S)-binding protein n=1 Tax=Roseibium sp. TrichSKD4 TaxID=744980 RepID=UPI001FFC3303|nr:(2Fe-2S)-binding protein [Roseibium sp. TrichSKD4]
MRQDPNGKMPTPGSVFRHLGCRPRCGGCFPNVIKVIHEEAPASSERSVSAAKTSSTAVPTDTSNDKTKELTHEG